jgi:hypothetical protein
VGGASSSRNRSATYSVQSERDLLADELHTITLVFMVVRHLEDVLVTNAKLEQAKDCGRVFADCE